MDKDTLKMKIKNLEKEVEICQAKIESSGDIICRSTMKLLMDVLTRHISDLEIFLMEKS